MADSEAGRPLKIAPPYNEQELFFRTMKRDFEAWKSEGPAGGRRVAMLVFKRPFMVGLTVRLTFLDIGRFETNCESSLLTLFVVYSADFDSGGQG